MISMVSVSSSDALQALQNQMDVVRIAGSNLKTIESETEAKIKQIQDEAAVAADNFVEMRETAVAKITTIFQQHRDTLLDGDEKTIVLRSGTISARWAPETLDITDPAAAERYLRQKGLWRKYTKLAKRKIDKTALKQDRQLVQAANPSIMRFTRAEHLILKLPKLQLEIKRDLRPFRSLLNKN